MYWYRWERCPRLLPLVDVPVFDRSQHGPLGFFVKKRCNCSLDPFNSVRPGRTESTMTPLGAEVEQLVQHQ